MILVLGAIINRSISDAELEADYVAVAVDILSADRPLSEDTVELEADVALRRWAVDVLELNTPVAMSAELKTSLRQGAREAAAASAEEILVSSTTADKVNPTKYQFGEPVSVKLQGIAGIHLLRPMHWDSTT